MQDSNNINLFNNYSIFYSHNNQLDKEYNSNEIKLITFDREDDIFINDSSRMTKNEMIDYYKKRLVFQYHKSTHDAFNIDRKRMYILSNGIIQATK